MVIFLQRKSFTGHGLEASLLQTAFRLLQKYWTVQQFLRTSLLILFTPLPTLM
jgi:hypothetical protein